MKLYTLEEIQNRFKFSRRFIVFLIIFFYFLTGVTYLTTKVGLSVLDSFYFSVITLSTVGYSFTGHSNLT